MSLRNQVESLAVAAAIQYVKMYYPTLIQSKNKELGMGKVTKVKDDKVTIKATNGSEREVTNLSNRPIGNDSAALCSEEFMLA